MGANCLAQTDALFRKNLVIQRRAYKTNCCLICFPFLICLLLGGTQIAVAIFYLRSVGHRPQIDCHNCTDVSFRDDRVGGLFCPAQCPLPVAPKWPPVLQLPMNSDLQLGLVAIVTKQSTGCVNRKCEILRGNIPCVISNMFPKHNPSNFAPIISTLADFALGSNAMRLFSLGADEFGSDFDESSPMFFLQGNCTANSTLSFPVKEGRSSFTKDAKCTEGIFLWRENMSHMNSELYQEHDKTNKIASAFDLTNSDLNKFNLIVSYNPLYKGVTQVPVLLVSLPPVLLRVPRLLNLVRGNDTKMRFEFVKDMPRAAEPEMPPDISFLVAKLVFVWIIMLLFPVILSNVVYEKQQKLRTMMKMHGLGDIAYWAISYCYFLLLSLLYMFFLVLFGSIIGIKLFKLNDYRVQCVIYFTYINLQISFAFLMATYYSNVRTATVTGYLFTIGSGFLGEYFFRPVVEDITLSKIWTTLLEFFPPFSLYRIIYEFSPPPSIAYRTDFSGIQWADLSDYKNGMIDILIIMVLEWVMFLFLTFYLDEFGTLRNGIRKMAVLCCSCLDRSSQAAQKQAIQLQEPKTSVEMDMTDVSRENTQESFVPSIKKIIRTGSVATRREIVERVLQESNSSYSIICDNLKKVYRGEDGNVDKIAVRGLSLSVRRGQCFGILGPNGAGKTSLISMLTGFTKPTSGTAYIDGTDIRLNMGKIYTRLGVCPQFDLLWETLTGREHLMFYGRLKQLRGSALAVAVEQSLKSVRLFDGGVAHKRVAKYSGGMKRRLSVAISLIGDPKVVYMDEPSSGLDPAPRKALWNAVMSAKQNKAIILTTHSMEEAEALCDRIGIIADGSLRCIGSSNELKSKYGGTYVLTVTTVAGEEELVEQLVRSISPAMNRTYHISGTQKLEMPKQGLRISELFQAMENAKSWLNILAWGLSDTTLEDVFIKVAQDSDISSV